jgi:hypothetical protein
MGGIGWVKTRVWDETHDVQKSMGWCPAVIDYNGDGKTGAYTKPDEPIDPKLDRAVDGAMATDLPSIQWTAAFVVCGIELSSARENHPHGGRRQSSGNVQDGSLRAAVR